MESIDDLRRLALLASQAPAEPDTLALAARVLREALDARGVHIIYVPAERFHLASDPPADEHPISDGGLRHVQRRLAARAVPLAFNLTANGRIEGLGALRKVHGRSWVAFPFPGRGNHADMLLVNGDWPGPVPERVLRLLETALPSLTVLIGRLLDGSQASRQREQLNALSEVAGAITNTRDMEGVLTRLATTIVGVTGYEFAILDVLAEDGRSLRFRCFNQSRWSDGPQIKTWREWGLNREVPDLFLEVARSHEALLMPDMQRDERVPQEMRDFFRASLLVSAAVLPLCFQEQVMGFFTVTSVRPHSFPPHETQFLQGLAAQAAAAINAVHTFEELEHSREQLREYAARLHEAMEEQHRLARTDALTGIPNRRYVEEVLRSACARARREGSPLSVVLVDIDDFKQINDTFGHRAGDRALVRLARLAQRHCRRMDLVGRYGGDEFIFVLPLADIHQAVGFAQRLRHSAVQRASRAGPGRPTNPTLSLGAAQLQPGDRSPDAVLQRADEALYRAKALGKDRVCSERQRAPAA